MLHGNRLKSVPRAPVLPFGRAGPSAMDAVLLATTITPATHCMLQHVPCCDVPHAPRSTDGSNEIVTNFGSAEP
eukprot:6035290-Pyramimonas_sp.AAC.1